MALSALDDLSVEPTLEQVSAVLEDSMEAWLALEAWCTQTSRVDSWEWISSGKKYGWGLRGKLRKRAILYMIPQHGSFLIGFVLGGRALEAVHEAPLSGGVKDVISSAKRYGEGTGFRLPVTTMRDLADIKALVEIKLRH
jgi:hypothetical protein